MKKINISKITKQLEAINSQSNKECNAGIQLIVNNIEIYNTFVYDFDITNSKNVYMICNLSQTIYNQLKYFNVFPDKKTKEIEIDNFQKMLERVNNS